MKKNILVLLIAMLIANGIFSLSASAGDYSVEIKRGTVSKQGGQLYWTIPTTLTNHTRDTLRYFSMSCSWQDFYSVSNANLKIETSSCYKNFPSILTLLPGESRTENIRLIVGAGGGKVDIYFKIGFNLMLASKDQNQFRLDFDKERKKGKCDLVECDFNVGRIVFAGSSEKMYSYLERKLKTYWYQ